MVFHRGYCVEVWEEKGQSYYGLWIIICFILAAAAIEQGEGLMIVIFGGLGICLAYLGATKDERHKKQQEEARKRAEAELRYRARQRFSDSYLANLIVRDLQLRNWVDLEDCNGCQVLKTKTITPYQTYIYLEDYGLGTLEEDGCRELATYLSLFYHGDYEITPIIRSFGGVSNSYSGYIGSDGSVSISQDAWGDDVVDGYRLCKKVVKPKSPQGKKW